jgi:hypothetical protein
VREEHRLRVFENRVLRMISGCKRDEVTGEDYIARNLMITKYHSGDQIKKNEIGRACNTYGGGETYIQDFDGESFVKETTCKTST